MKRNFLGIITVIIVVVAVGYNMYAIQNKKTRLTDLTLFNIEALAQNEGGNYSCTVTVDCGFPLSGSISCTGMYVSEVWIGQTVLMLNVMEIEHIAESNE